MHRGDAVKMGTVLLSVHTIAGINLRVGLVSRDQLRSPAHIQLRAIVYEYALFTITRKSPSCLLESFRITY